jgi:hypothetical protein
VYEVRVGSRLCENSRELKMRRMVFSVVDS